MAGPRLNGAISAWVPKHPATALDLAKLRKTKDRTFTDRVEPYYVKLVTDLKLGERFRALMDSVIAYDSVEGKVSFDECEAARMVREAAQEVKDDVVSKALPGTYKDKDGVEKPGARGLNKIAIALRVVAKRHQMSRTARLAAAKEAMQLAAAKDGDSLTEH
jgi:hypothetical protein